MTLFFLLNPKQFDIGALVEAVGGYKKRKRHDEETKLEAPEEVRTVELEEKIQNLAEISSPVTKLRQKITENISKLENFEKLQEKFLKLQKHQLTLAQLVLQMDEEERAFMSLLLSDDI